MKEEVIDIVDETNHLTGQKTSQDYAHQKGLWHRSVHIWIYNKKGEVLMQLRSKNMSLYPGLWDTSVAGHISSDEKPIKTALREIFEEAGLKLKKEDLEFTGLIKRGSKFDKIINNEFYYTYLVKYNKSIKKLKPQKEEVDKLKFFKISTLIKNFKKEDKKFVPHYNYYLTMMNVIKERLKKK